MCFSVLGTVSKGWNSSFSWAWPEHILGHWEGLLGLVTSLGSFLDARHFPWAFGQLGKAPGPWPGWSQLGKAGQGSWACLGLGWSLWHSQNTLTHTFSRIPGLTLRMLFFWWFWDFLSFAQFFSSFGTFCRIGTFCSFGNLWPHIGHQNVTGPPGALSFDVKPEKVTTTAVSSELPLGHLLHNFPVVSS